MHQPEHLEVGRFDAALGGPAHLHAGREDVLAQFQDTLPGRIEQVIGEDDGSDASAGEPFHLVDNAFRAAIANLWPERRAKRL